MCFVNSQVLSLVDTSARRKDAGAGRISNDKSPRFFPSMPLSSDGQP